MLVRLSRSDHWMSARVRMFARVAIGGTIAAKRDPAFLAGAQVNPICTDLDALLALSPLGKRHRGDGLEMGTVFARHIASSFLRPLFHLVNPLPVSLRTAGIDQACVTGQEI